MLDLSRVEKVNFILEQFAIKFVQGGSEKVPQFALAILCKAKGTYHNNLVEEVLNHHSIPAPQLSNVITEIRNVAGDDLIEILPHSAYYFISEYFPGNWNEYSQPREITQLVHSLMKEKGCKRIYNPFAGIGSYSKADFCESYIGQDKNIAVCDITNMLLDLSGFKNSVFINGDSVKAWNDQSADCIVATPPFGKRIDYFDASEYSGWTYDEFVITKFLASKAPYGFFVVPRGFCFRNSGYSFALRKTITEKNYLEMAVNLPTGIFPHTGISTSLIVLNKNRGKNSKSIFVDAVDMFSMKSKSIKVLDVNSILSSIASENSKSSYQVSKSDLFKMNCSFDASSYAVQNLEVAEGQKVVSLSDVLNPSTGEKCYFNDEKVNNVIESSNFVDNITLLGNVNNTVYVNQPKYKFTGHHLAINMQGKVYLHNSEGSFYIGTALSNLVFRVNTELVDSEYLAYVILSNSVLQKSYFGTNAARSNPRFLLKYQVVIEADIKKQRQIVTNIKRKYFESEKQRLNIREAGGDLSHMLRMPKEKIGNQINRLLASSELSEKDRSRVKVIEDNFNYILRVIETVGADFSAMKITTHEVHLAQFLNGYAASLKNMQFSNIYSILLDIKLPDEVAISCDEDLIRVLLDTAYLNAYKHAFSDKGSDDNKVLLGCQAVEFKGEPFACLTIANNGNPLTISIEDFITRGVVDGETGNTGKGGYHIYAITKKHGGYINLTSSQEWPFMLEVLLPIKYIKDYNLPIYESKCV